MNKRIIIILAIIGVFSLSMLIPKYISQGDYLKINGITIVSPQKETGSAFLGPIKRINANWIAIIPYAACFPGDPKIYYNNVYYDWGDTPEGIKYIASLAKENDIKVMLKPHVWVVNQGWPGDFNLNYLVWKEWEKNYIKFIMDLAQLAETEGIDMFCIGTEFKTAVQRHPGFWNHLIDTIQHVYSGNLTYAANFESYQKVPFWDKLDFIGIDAFLPLKDEETPTKKGLIDQWSLYRDSMALFSKKFNKQILFTEFGSRKMDEPSSSQWEIENISSRKYENQQSQADVYNAMFEIFWNKIWFAGGFAWKWAPPKPNESTIKDANIQNPDVPVEEVIRLYYSARRNRDSEVIRID
ncbi:hypothetical protein ACFL6I_19900 [candidate division KSB1 bacterium]